MNNTIITYLKQIRKMYNNSTQFRRVVEYYDWILSNGKTFEKTKTPEYYGNMKECYYNAQNLALDGKIDYFEGWGTTKNIGIPFEHGFNVVQDTVIDPTWKDGNLYFGIKIPTDYIRNHWIEHGIAENLLSRYYYEVIKCKK